MEAVDLDHLGRYTGGDRTVNGDILGLFDAQIMGLVAELSATRCDPSRWREIAHTIKGAAGGVGAFALGEAAARAEHTDPADTVDARTAIEALKSEACSVHGFIQAYLGL
ncbi:MAG: Hpt domain-containing protein [Rhizomicrobium sp.]